MADVMTSHVAARKISFLRGDLDRRLSSYAVAACAAGVGMLPLAPPAKADIIYTPANQRLGTESSLSRPLPGLGIRDRWAGALWLGEVRRDERA
jgi:hypothetical protein